jgi:hypothetical protein
MYPPKRRPVSEPNYYAELNSMAAADIGGRGFQSLPVQGFSLLKPYSITLSLRRTSHRCIIAPTQKFVQPPCYSYGRILAQDAAAP